ncbi:T9SS type A sorting domain-containing protein [Fluviicola sp.]|uniref:T9SS type A sorting domain-containing protein n=1 Tax=Fluviicola sp. TaxID=1917219 RepID=UPI003D2A5987
MQLKALLTLFILFSGFLSFSQTEKYQIDLHTGGYEFTKTVVKDYGTHQLVGGTDRYPTGTIGFWFAKLNGNQVIWSKAVPAHDVWAYMDISPLDITECPNGDVVFIARGNLTSGDYSAKVVKVSAAGQLIWTKEILTEQGTYSQTVYENNPVIVENDGIIISMTGSNHLQVTKINFDGDVLYSKQLKVQGTSTPLNPGHLFIPNNSGGYFAGFECDNSPAIISLDASLNILWSRKIESDQTTQLRSLLQLPSGKLLIGGIAETDAFMATLYPNGMVQDYHRFDHSVLYSADQLFQFDSSTILVNGRNSYGFVNLDNWTFHEITHNAPFAAFYPSANGWTFGSHWLKEYFLDFNPGIPECFDNLNVFPFSMQTVNRTDTAIQASITDMGEVMDIVIPVSDLQATLNQGCSLGIQETEQGSFIVSPNPTTGTVSITHPDGAGEVLVYDIFGKLVLSTQTQTATQTKIDLSGEAPGIYLIKIDGMGVNRVVKE